MAAPGLPLGGMVAHTQAALLAQQQLAARAAGAGQPLRGVAGGAAAVAAAAAAAAAAADAKKLAGKKRKAAEKPVSEKALHLVPESPLFNSLVTQEHHVDELIKRQRLELHAAANPLECPVHKRLRVYIFNTHSNQPQDAAGSDGPQQQQGRRSSQSSSSSSTNDDREPPHWTLVVWGRLENPDPPYIPKVSPPQAAAAAAGTADAAASTAEASTAAAAAPEAGSATPAAAADPSPPAAAAAAAAAAAGGGVPAPPAINVSTLPPQPAAQHGVQHKHPLSGFFRRVQFQLDPQQYPGDANITWDKLHHRGAHKDRFEIKRVGSQPTQVTITFEQDFVPPVYKVDPRLAEVLCMPFGQQQMVMTRLYSYIINVKQQPDLAQLQLDDKLEAILGTKQLAAAALPQAVGRLLQPLEPVTVTHTITTSGTSPITCVDFDVLLPVKMDKVAPAIDPLLDDKQFEALDHKVDASLAKLFEARRRRDMYLGFAEDPVAFLNTIIASQARELRVSRNNQAVAIERRTDLFRDKWVDEAALRYLGRKSKQEGLFPALNTQQQQGPP